MANNTYLKINWNSVNETFVPTKKTFDGHKHSASDITGGTIEGNVTVR